MASVTWGTILQRWLYQDIGLINPGRTDSPALFAPDNLPDAVEILILGGKAYKVSIQHTSLSITC